MPSPERLRWARRVVFALGLLPLLRLLVLGFTDALGANPVEFVIRSTGTWALNMLLLTLAVTPARRLLNLPWLLVFRRMLGLYAFFYACLHMLGYVVVDQWLDAAALWKDIMKRPFITVGVLCLLGLLPLAVTSTNAMMRRLGRNWARLHRIVYPVAMLAVLHYFWLVKRDTTTPLVYAFGLALLLGYRLWNRTTIATRTTGKARS